MPGVREAVCDRQFDLEVAVSLRTGIFKGSENGCLGSPEEEEANESPAPHKEETRTEVFCDGWDPDPDDQEAVLPCMAVRFWVADLGPEPSGHGWLSKDGKDYCGHHSKPFRDAEFEQLKERLASGNYSPPSDNPTDGGAIDLDDELDQAEVIAGLREAFEGPLPSAPSPMPSGWWYALYVALLLVIFGLAMALGHAYLRIDNDELEISIATRDAFEERASIRELGCRRSGNTFACSGEIFASGQPVKPVRYTCDNDSCRFEGGK